MPGPAPKQTGRQRRNTVELATVSPISSGLEVPVPSAKWRPEIILEWSTAWESELGSYWLESTDLPVLRRVFDLRDRLAGIDETLDEEGPLSTGSMGQTVEHPLIKIGNTLRSELRNLEDRTGLSPMARLRLGVKVGEAARSLDEMNRRLRRTDEEELDPRTVIDLDSLGS